jgi:hypothetical protein
VGVAVADFNVLSVKVQSRDSSVSIALGYGLDDRGWNSGGDCEFFSSTPRPDRLGDQPSLLSSGHWELFPWG